MKPPGLAHDSIRSTDRIRSSRRLEAGRNCWAIRHVWIYGFRRNTWECMDIRSWRGWHDCGAIVARLVWPQEITDIGIPIDRTIYSRTNLAGKIYGAESVASTERTYDTSRSSYRSYGTISEQFCFDWEIWNTRYFRSHNSPIYNSIIFNYKTKLHQSRHPTSCTTPPILLFYTDPYKVYR